MIVTLDQKNRPANGIRHCVQMLLLLACFGLTGCQHTRGLAAKSAEMPDSRLPSYSAIVLNYETTDFRSLVSRLHPSTVGSNITNRIQQVSVADTADLSENSLSSQWSQARIQIIYPHPDGSTDKGLARLVVARKSSGEHVKPSRADRMKGQWTKFLLQATGTSEELAELKAQQYQQVAPVDEEIWQLDLPKEELDILISELSHRGFFEKQERPRGDALVTIKLDEGALSKRWTNEPRLEGLMLQVYNEGELTAFNARPSRVSPMSYQKKSEEIGG